jgi:hypothetical protein
VELNTQFRAGVARERRRRRQPVRRSTQSSSAGRRCPLDSDDNLDGWSDDGPDSEEQ